MAESRYGLTLFITGITPRSMRAVANMRAFCDELGSSNSKLSIFMNTQNERSPLMWLCRRRSFVTDPSPGPVAVWRYVRQTATRLAKSGVACWMSDDFKRGTRGPSPTLAEAEDMLRAIRAGEIDAIVVKGGAAPAVYTLKSAADPYRHLVEQMSEGALTLSSTGVILYCNAAFARMIERPRERLVGSLLSELIVRRIDQAQLTEFLDRTARGGQEIEFRAAVGNRARLLSLRRSSGSTTNLCIVWS